MPRKRKVRLRRATKSRRKARASSPSKGARSAKLSKLSKLSNLEHKKYPVPKGVQVAAKDGLRLVAEGYGGKGLTDEALDRARKLARGVPISHFQTRPDGSTNKSSAQFMHAWFARHKVDKRPGWQERATPGWVAWQIWGGDAAKRWVDRIMEG